ncbi:FAD-dependent thymidylate synthase [Rhodococcus sp. NPDC047139]|uniref:FAD-dependent thymidylate synthase n=1 Tax=Rhodococcus sp. NPDC047139 TaxID=3155141 RepID=UPI0033C6701C
MVPEPACPKVRLVATTEFHLPEDVDWGTDADGGEALIEFAGRACYQSWDKPNPRTATNAGYLRHLLTVGYLSALEHATATFYITGISRSCTHELIRHRHFSFSQLSQRFVADGDVPVVVPPAIEGDPELESLFFAAAERSREAYVELLAALDEKMSHLPAGPLRAKQVREAARSVLPNATETRIVVTGNYRSWRHFVAMRATEHADVEIRRLAVECVRRLAEAAPNAFSDFVISTLPDGSEVAVPTLATDL